MADYRNYETFLQNRNSLHNFKNNTNYTYVLEHVSKEHGYQYYNLLKDLYSNDVLLSFCNLNDSIGDPIKHSIGNLSHPVSPTSLRYLYHAHLILEHFSNKPEIHIVEVGGGYGGLCLALSYLSRFKNINIQSYHIIDLDTAVNLQKDYLKNFTLTFDITFSSSNEYGKSLTRTDYCLISNYCFTEIDKYHQQQYLIHLFPKTDRGFIIWNHIPLYDIGKEVVVKEEIPLTGSGNLFVFF